MDLVVIKSLPIPLNLIPLCQRVIKQRRRIKKSDVESFGQPFDFKHDFRSPKVLIEGALPRPAIRAEKY